METLEPPIQGIVIALGGRDQVSRDPADPNHGVFLLAIDLYEQGYEVHIYDEDEVDADGLGGAYDEVVRAVQNRGVAEVAILGYSHGGGSTHDLAERVHLDRPVIGSFDIAFTGYIDAVQNSADLDPRAETRRPPGSMFHVNYFQVGSIVDLGLDGGPTDDPPGADFELNVESPTQTHYTIDNDPIVLNGIEAHLVSQAAR